MAASMQGTIGACGRRKHDHMTCICCVTTQHFRASFDKLVKHETIHAIKAGKTIVTFTFSSALYSSLVVLALQTILVTSKLFGETLIPTTTVLSHRPHE